MYMASVFVHTHTHTHTHTHKHSLYNHLPVYPVHSRPYAYPSEFNLLLCTLLLKSTNITLPSVLSSHVVFSLQGSWPTFSLQHLFYFVFASSSPGSGWMDTLCWVMKLDTYPSKLTSLQLSNLGQKIESQLLWTISCFRHQCPRDIYLKWQCKD